MRIDELCDWGEISTVNATVVVSSMKRTAKRIRPQGYPITMKKDLSFYQTRLLGCLIEKSITTPDQYPLSLNALTNACNQKSNREPVLDLEEVTVQITMDELISKGLAIDTSPTTARTRKYKHLFCNTPFGNFDLSDQQLAVICVIFLRGPQTPGELRSRTNRLAQFDSLAQVEATLENLIQHKEGPLVVKLEREPGKRESRYAHLFSGDDVSQWQTAISSETEPSASTDLTERVALLEQQVMALQNQIAILQQNN